MKKKRGDWKRTQKPFTLCWDCAHATDDSCAWVRDGEPVEGWTARETKLLWARAYSSSYHVAACPQFKRDAENGGQKKYVSHLEYVPLKGERHNGNSNHSKHRPVDAWSRVAVSRRPVSVDNGSGAVACCGSGKARRSVNRDTLDLAFGIIERAVLDWKALEYGRRAECVVDGELVNRAEAVEFFFSDWFYSLCNVTQFTPEQIRGFLHIQDDALEIIREAEERRKAIDAGF